jgi:hypothetical protein
VGKTVSARDMLKVGRRPSPPVEQSAPTSANAQADNQATSGLVDQGASPLVTQSYEKAAFFLTADQRRWLRDTARNLSVDGLSASDIVRLAISRLRDDIETGGVELVDTLIAQAHAEAATHPGRRNRGLPRRQRGD